MGEIKIYKKIVVNFIIALIILLFVIFLLPKLLSFFLPFVIGWIISMIANPLVKFMEKKIKLIRKHSSAIIIVVVLAAVIGILYFAVSFFVKELWNLFYDFPNLYAQMDVKLHQAGARLNKFYEVLPKGVKTYLDNQSHNVNQYSQKIIGKIDTPGFKEAGSFARNLADGLFVSIITILSAYFFTAEHDNIVHSVKKVTPLSVQKQYTLVINNFTRAFGGYIKAQFKIMIIITGIIFVGFEILGVGYSFLLALAIAFLDLLPIFGTGAVLWPWALIDAVTGNYVRATGFIIIYIICQVVKQLLQPKMVGDSIGLSPLATLVFMFIGYRLHGIFGLIIGIPIGMVIINFYQSGLFDRLIRGAKIVIHDINEYRKF